MAVDEFVRNREAWLLAGLPSLITVALVLWGVWGHLKNYRSPVLQRTAQSAIWKAVFTHLEWVGLTIRILWMPAIYAVTSWIAFGWPAASIVLDPLRDCYEAFILWVFFQLLIQLMDGERAMLVTMDDGRLPIRHLFPLQWLPLDPIDFSNPEHFLRVKRGILQFVLVKPVLAVLVITLRWAGVYREGDISAFSAYIYLTVLYNCSVCVSLYSLALFYVATQYDLHTHRPLLKFACIKAVLFFSFWQSILVSILVHAGGVYISQGMDTGSLAVAIQDFLICFEMMVIAALHRMAFPFQPFQEMRSARLALGAAVQDAFGCQDLVWDAKHTWQGTNFLWHSGVAFERVPTDPSLLRDDTQRYVSALDEALEFSDIEQESSVEKSYQDALRLQTGDYGYNVRS